MISTHSLCSRACGVPGQWPSRNRRLAPARSVIAAWVAGCLAVTGCGGLGQPKQAINTRTQEYVAQFKAIDSAQSGRITLDQANAYYRQRFADLDANKDGFLDQAEFAGLRPDLSPQTAGDLFNALDNNGDHKLSQAELLILVNSLFSRSSQSDGTLTLEDVVHPPSAPQGPPPGAAPAGGSPPGGSTGGTPTG